MIDAIATRRTTLNGTTYAKGDKAAMPLQQFTDLEPTGRFERAPVEVAPEPAAPIAVQAPRKTASKTAR